MSYNAKAQAKYRKKRINIAVMYSPTDIGEGKRIKAYLEKAGISANSYIKSLIKQDLDNKGFFITDTDQDTSSNNDTDDTADI